MRKLFQTSILLSSLLLSGLALATDSDQVTMEAPKKPVFTIVSKSHSYWNPHADGGFGDLDLLGFTYEAHYNDRLYFNTEEPRRQHPFRCRDEYSRGAFTYSIPISFGPLEDQLRIIRFLNQYNPEVDPALKEEISSFLSSLESKAIQERNRYAGENISSLYVLREISQ